MRNAIIEPRHIAGGQARFVWGSSVLTEPINNSCCLLYVYHVLATTLSIFHILTSSILAKAHRVESPLYGWVNWTSVCTASWGHTKWKTWVKSPCLQSTTVQVWYEHSYAWEYVRGRVWTRVSVCDSMHVKVCELSMCVCVEGGCECTFRVEWKGIQLFPSGCWETETQDPLDTLTSDETKVKNDQCPGSWGDQRKRTYLCFTLVRSRDGLGNRNMNCVPCW